MYPVWISAHFSKQLIAIYFKGDREDISVLELNVHVASTILELEASNVE